MKPLIVGLTGGIGSGKSTVGEAFCQLGVPVINADQSARAVVSVGQPALEKLTNHFGTEILNPDGSLDRAALQTIIFSDPQKKRYVEELLHPLIQKHIRLQIENIDSPYVVIEIPLLIEAGWQQFVDQILVTDLAEDLQFKRIVARSNSSSAIQINKIIASQLTRSERNRHANQIIDTSLSLPEVSQQVSELHRHYLKLAEMRHP